MVFRLELNDIVNRFTGCWAWTTCGFTWFTRRQVRPASACKLSYCSIDYLRVNNCAEWSPEYQTG